jgi:hypothetical protein
MAATLAIIVRFQFAGIHNWPGAPRDVDESYLAYPHRHMFHVEAIKAVNHAERDIEFIALKNEMQKYCEHHFDGPHTLSCESMALRLIADFDLKVCRVLEDNENGAEVTA